MMEFISENSQSDRVKLVSSQGGEDKHEDEELDSIVFSNYQRYWSTTPKNYDEELLLPTTPTNTKATKTYQTSTSASNATHTYHGNHSYAFSQHFLIKRRILPLLIILIISLTSLVHLLQLYYNARNYRLIVLERRLPSAIIIGARKCGTRALLDMLGIHPQVQKSPFEVHFFDRDENYNLGLDWYRLQMPESAPHQISIEKSPSYFVTPEVPERIYGMNSSIKLLLIVRNPVTRLVSDYTQIYYGMNSSSSLSSTSSSGQPPTFESLVFNNNSVNINYKAVRISIYARYLLRWLDVFPLEQIHIIDGELLIRDPFKVLVEVEEFLGLEHKLQNENFYYNATKGFYCWRELSSGEHCLNESKGRRHPVIKEDVLDKLRSFYRKHNELFYEMSGREFGW